ncbi:MAG: amidohydrolase [Bacteroidetes bacterium]|nr:amidohydrolase [Bacteroidota bacterium]
MRIFLPLLLIFAFFPSLSGQGNFKAVSDLAFAERQYLEKLYLDLHQSPELSFYEVETAKRMAAEMEALGLEVHTGVGGNGVVGIMRNGDGPTIMLRGDMDGLPVKEETGLPYASTVTTTDEAGNTVSVMHACGHDIHMSVLIGSARVLHNIRDQWSGTIILNAQPAEERAGGAKAMIADGLFEDYGEIDFALGLHVNASTEAGTIGYCPGYMMANVDMMDITVYGEGGHGAYPHTTQDPVVLASRIVMALQTIVSREISPLEPAVVTVGAINGGTKGNIIPGEVKLQLTMRSYSDEVRDAIIEKIERICKGVAMSAGLPEDKYPNVHLRDEYTPAVYNDPDLTDRIAKVFKGQFGEDRVQTLSPVMGGEDFGRYGLTEENIPILFFWLGAVPAERMQAAGRGEINLPSLHSAEFYPDYEKTMQTGVAAMTAAVLELMN